MILFLALFGCGGGGVALDPDVASRVLSLEPHSLSQCEPIEFPEIQSICRVSVAARAAASGDDRGAMLACSAMDEGMWKEECHFRAGEELGRLGNVERSLEHCALAGEYARNCVTHAAWGMPAIEGLNSRSENALQEIERFGSSAQIILGRAGEGVSGEGLDVLLARAWFNLYLGSGVADPEVAREAVGLHGSHAMTSWALEAVRLLAPDGSVVPSNIVSMVSRAWHGRDSVPEGYEKLHRRVGRYSSPILPDDARVHEHVATFGGGVRLVGDNEEDELLIATLEALYFREGTPPELFGPYLTHASDKVRWTAGKLFALSAGQGDDRVNELLESDDRVFSNYVWQALVKQGARIGEESGEDQE
jgi:hypothetical protein